MSAKLTLNNGYTLCNWDEDCIASVLSESDKLPSQVRKNLIIEGGNNQEVLELLKTFSVKAIDNHGMCIHGDSWDKLDHISDLIDYDIDREYVAGVFLSNVRTDIGKVYIIKGAKHIGFVLRNGFNWIWSVYLQDDMNKPKIKDTSIKLTLAVIACSKNMAECDGMTRQPRVSE